MNIKNKLLIVLFSMCFGNCKKETITFYSKTNSAIIIHNKEKILSYKKCFLNLLNAEDKNKKYELRQFFHKCIIYSSKEEKEEYQLFTFNQIKYPVLLNDENKIIFKTKNLQFIFRYEDVINFLKARLDTKDAIYSHYNQILNLILDKKNKTHNYFNEYLLSDLLKNIPFSLKFKDKTINKIAINDVFTGYSQETEHYLIDKKGDTIAYFMFRDWIM